MQPDRIYFKDNPWPEGHRIATFVWSARNVEGDVWFDMHLESDDYYAEREIDDDDDADYGSDWEAPIVWGNYHSCTLSTNEFHAGGFRVCTVDEYSPDFLDGLELLVDANVGAEQIEAGAHLAFRIYLLGHDAVANHRLTFERVANSERFRIVWSGQIAMAYVGDYALEHSFRASISSAAFPALPG
ncbi:hypothetical protein [Pseudomonas sp. Marseille-QA0892]